MHNTDAPGHGMSNGHISKHSKTEAAIEFAHQAERLGQLSPDQEDDMTGSTQAIEAKFITAQDPVIETANGGRLPAVPIEEATKLNELRDELDDLDPSQNIPAKGAVREALDGTIHGVRPNEDFSNQKATTDAPLYRARPPPRTSPLFPPLPMYGPPTGMRRAQCWVFRISSAVLSFCFLLVIILGAAFTSIPNAGRYVWLKLNGEDPDSRRPFYQEERRREKKRLEAEKAWESKKQRMQTNDSASDEKMNGSASHKKEMNSSVADETSSEFPPLEGGPDRLICDPRYYARRVGLDMEIFDVQTEDGFIIELWHVYDPKEYHRTDPSQREPHSPEVFPTNFTEHGEKNGASGAQYPPGKKKYPILMIHGLLQSAGAYCTNDDDSLAFFLAKSGYDVWLGNNRCGFRPRHNLLSYDDPRMWAWNIRQMGVMDLPALISRVLSETGFPQLGLIAHSQGTTQTLVALAKEQRPEIGDKISVFCALAPAAYAGPLIGKMYFKFMRVISPGMFRAMFGIHAFIPLMMTMHSLLPGKLYGAMGYRVFSFLFNWTDDRWDKGLRARLFQFSPVYVSAESMRWWLGRECFAKHKCVLSTKREKMIEDEEDELEDRLREKQNDQKTQPAKTPRALQNSSSKKEDMGPSGNSEDDSSDSDSSSSDSDEPDQPTKTDSQPSLPHHRHRDRSKYSWYPPHTPPFAFWACGSDDLVDSRRLLRRFERGREPHVDVVHAKVIDGYEHLDVIWAVDVISKVGKELREVLWKTAAEEARKVCRVPRGCEGVSDFYVRKAKDGDGEVEAEHRQRREEKERDGKSGEGEHGTEVKEDVSSGDWTGKGAVQASRGRGGEDRDKEREIEGAND